MTAWLTISVSGEAILSYENGGTPLGGRGSAPNPAVGAHSVSLYPLAGGEGLFVPPQEPYPAFGLRKFGLDLRPFVLPPQWKNLGHAFVQQLYRMIGAYVYMKNAVATVTQDLHEVFYPTPRDGQHSLFFWPDPARNMSSTHDSTWPDPTHLSLIIEYCK